MPQNHKSQVSLSVDDVRLLRPLVRRAIAALVACGTETAPDPDSVTTSDADDFIRWLWSHPDERPVILAALAEARAAQQE